MKGSIATSKADQKQIARGVEEAFQKSVKVELQDPDHGIFVITLPFMSRTSHAFYIWAFRYPGSRKLQLSDGGLLTKELGKVGSLELEAIKLLVNSYGLSLMEDLSVMETSTRPLPKRVTSFLQALVAIDGMLRAWTAFKEKK